MTIILRLQGLDAKAGTEDIRIFFECLDIPDGGVYILGGSLREAFIAFKSEKDAQLAMHRTGDFLKGSKVSLHISNMAEMEHKLKTLLKKKRKPSPTQLTEKSPQPKANAHPLKASPTDPRIASASPTAQLHTQATVTEPILDADSIDSQTAFLLGICTVLQGLQSSYQRENEAVSRAEAPMIDLTDVTDEKRIPEQNPKPGPGYVRLFGLPPSTTKDDICQFFGELTVQEAIVNVKLGVSHGCLVKFENEQDACSALSFNQHSLGPIRVEVRSATEKMWTSALQECENANNNQERVTPKQSPLRETVNHKQKTPVLPKKRQRGNHLPFKSPKKMRSDCDSTTAQTVESIVMVSNLPISITKTEIKELFGCPNIAHKNVLHLLDCESNRTDTAFLIFNQTEDYDYAMNLSGCHVGSGAIKVSSITKEEMNAMIAKTHPRNLRLSFKRWNAKKPLQKRKPSGFKKVEVTQSKNLNPAAQTCLFVRNMPADVQTNQIKTLFWEYKLRQDNIMLLHDSDGRCIGEAVVQFQSPKTAALAQALHGRDFLGTKVLITRINMKQKEDILARNVWGS